MSSPLPPPQVAGSTRGTPENIERYGAQLPPYDGFAVSQQLHRGAEGVAEQYPWIAARQALPLGPDAEKTASELADQSAMPPQAAQVASS